MKQRKPQAHQKLWLVRYGTMTQLVWAGTPENAERKVRTGLLGVLVTEDDLAQAESATGEPEPVRVTLPVGAARPQAVGSGLKGPMTVREATDADLVEHWPNEANA